MQTADMQTCRLADLQTCRPADLQTCRPEDLQTRRQDSEFCRLIRLDFQPFCKRLDWRLANHCRPAYFWINGTSTSHVTISFWEAALPLASERATSRSGNEIGHVSVQSRSQRLHSFWSAPRMQDISIPLTVNARGLWGRDWETLQHFARFWRLKLVRGLERGVSKYSTKKNEYLRASNASYTFQLLMSFWYYLLFDS